jgi:putative ABC transport system ATP-binding protein
MPSHVFRLEAIGLHKFYEEGPVRVHAVRGVDIQIKAGTLVLLMGPSGSGKSTLLSMLGCILKPSQGMIRLMGEPVVWAEHLLPLIRRRYLGFVFQHFNLFSPLTAAENVEVSLRLKGSGRRKAKREARALLEAVGLAERWNFLPRDLSGGEKQRVAIARALAGNPPILLADEPTGNLDSTSGRVVTELLKAATGKENRSVIVVSHDTRLLEFADQVFSLEDGRLTLAQIVAAGQIIAQLDDGDLRAQLAQAKAHVDETRAKLHEVEPDSRPQELEAAQARLQEAQVVLDEAKSTVDRYRELLKRGMVSQAQFDEAQRQYQVALARHHSAREQLSLLQAGTREEAKRVARAQVRKAEADRGYIGTLLQNTVIKAPAAGKTLERHMQAGEVAFSLKPRPIVILADLSRLLVRAEVDETDIRWVQVGQEAIITSDAYPGEEFRGTVVEIGTTVGRKSIHPEEPAEMVDTKVLGVKIELPRDAPLPLGLTADVRIMVVKKDNVLVVLRKAVEERDGESSVSVKTHDTYTQ